MSIFVGIDAGGSGTACVVERDGARTPSNGAAVNVRTLGVDRAAEAIAQTLRAALHGERPDAIAVGAAGAGDSAVAAALRAKLEAVCGPARVAVYDDAAIALRAAVPAGDGIVLIAGTGSIAYGLFGERIVRAGGYGALLGDEGSGFAIGRAALSLVLRSLDGRAPHDSLVDALCTALDAHDPAGTLARIHAGGEPVAAIAALAPLIVERASAGERSGSKIVQAAALELTDLVKAVVKRADASGRELPLVFGGGLLAHNTLLSFLIETRLTADLPMLAVVKSPPAPVLGALALARAAAGAA